MNAPGVAGADRTPWLAAPSALFLLSLFIYPCLYGLWLSFRPAEGGALGLELAEFGDAHE